MLPHIRIAGVVLLPYYDIINPVANQPQNEKSRLENGSLHIQNQFTTATVGK